MRYFITVFYNPGYDKRLRFMVMGYVDNTQILSFDSEVSQRVEPRVPFMAQDPEHLEELALFGRRVLLIGRIELWTLFGFRSQRETGE